MKKDDMRVLVAGCGTISGYWFEYTLSRPDCRIVGIVDIDKSRAEATAAKYGLNCPVFTGLDEALVQVSPDIVYDLTYVTTHSKIVTQALEAGCHVFGEKPMTLTRQEAQEMMKTADRTGRVYNVMQNRRYQKPVQAIRELVASGRLGKLWMVSADIFVGADLSSIRNLLEKPMLQDNAIHTFDQARYLTGEDAASVYCHSYNPPRSKYHGDAAGACIFEMSGGTVFIYNCVMGAEGCLTSWESSWRIMGSEGSVIWDGRSEPYAEIKRAGGGQDYLRFNPETGWAGQDQHFGCLEEMYSALLAGRPSGTDCHDNYRSISMAFSALDSSSAGQKAAVY